MSLNTIPSIPPFDPHTDSHNVGLRWERWLTQFEFYLQATGITNPLRQKGLLLHSAGRHLQEIFKTITTTEPGSADDNFENAIATLQTLYERKDCYYTVQDAIFKRFLRRSLQQSPALLMTTLRTPLQH